MPSLTSSPSPNTRRESVSELVDHLFRHKAGQMISALTRYFGIENLKLVEDIVQDSLLKALQQWPYRGIPANPGGWLWQAAKNHTLDVLRREAKFQKRLQGQVRLAEVEQFPTVEDISDYPFEDDQLSMMFIGCHPTLSREVQIALVLNTVSGFSAGEIARAFLVPEATMAQRLVRAKNKLREEGAQFEIPPTSELTERLDVVMNVLYLLFNEGYDAHAGDSLVRQELCFEAIHLCHLVATHPVGQIPRVHALLALMLLQASRLDARTDAHGNVILLADQNRSAWDREMIHAGLHHLALSAEGDELSEYHLQAGIAARHAVAKSDESTDWVGILNDYKALLEITPSHVVLLNHAVAIARVYGPEAGLNELAKLRDHASLRKYHLLPATFGELYERSRDYQRAAQSYRQALLLTSNEAEQRFLQKKLRASEMLLESPQ